MSRNQKTGAKIVLTIFICTPKISPAFCRGRDASRQEVVAVFAVAPRLTCTRTSQGLHGHGSARGLPRFSFSGPSGSFSATVHINHQKEPETWKNRDARSIILDHVKKNPAYFL